MSLILFHFNYSLSHASLESYSPGTGHAFRCLTLSKILPYDAIFIINRSHDAKNYCQAQKISFCYEDELHLVLSSLDIRCIVSDINYLSQSFVEIYRESGLPVVCLSPRGDFKFYSDCTIIDFLDSIFPSISSESFNPVIHSGSQYSIINPKVLSYLSIPKIPSSIIISLGGADNYRFLNKVFDALLDADLDPSTYITAISPRNFVDDKSQVSSLRSKFTSFSFLPPSPRFLELLSAHQICITLGGITTYEAISLRTFPINLCPTNFHLKRSLSLESDNVSYSVDLSSNNNNLDFSFIKPYLKPHSDHVFPVNPHQVVDGHGVYRASSLICGMIDK